MTTRKRSQYKYGNAGYCTRNGAVIGNYGQLVRTHNFIEDVAGTKGDNEYLQIEKWESSGGEYSYYGDHTNYADKHVMLGCSAASDWNHLTVDGIPTIAQAAVNAAARTNPSAPYVDVPVMLMELGDIAQLIRDSGRSILKQAASANIKYQFGIAPLAGDLAKLVYFNDQVERRVRVLESLRTNKGYRKTVTVFKGSDSVVEDRTLHSNLYFATGKAYGNTTVKVRAHCRWIPDSTLQLLSDKAVVKLAKRALLGLTFDASSMWELFPWTWLIDWCTDIGKFLQSRRNIVPATLQSVSVMQHFETSWRMAGKSSSSFTQTKFALDRTTKSRRPASVYPSAHFPFLDEKQMGILGSLYVLRRR